MLNQPVKTGFWWTLSIQALETSRFSYSGADDEDDDEDDEDDEDDDDDDDDDGDRRRRRRLGRVLLMLSLAWLGQMSFI